jgi:hypothetical protein
MGDVPMHIVQDATGLHISYLSLVFSLGLARFLFRRLSCSFTCSSYPTMLSLVVLSIIALSSFPLYATCAPTPPAPCNPDFRGRKVGVLNRAGDKQTYWGFLRRPETVNSFHSMWTTGSEGVFSSLWTFDRVAGTNEYTIM